MPPCKVKMDGRNFTVHFAADGSPARISERKLHAKGTFMECYFNAPYWSAKHHKLSGPKTLPARILEAARATQG